MNWYLKNIFAQGATMLSYLESLGATPDIVQYVDSLDPNVGQILTNEFRKNPSLNLLQLQQFQTGFSKNLPYTEYELKKAVGYPEPFKKWLLVHLRKTRISKELAPEHQKALMDRRYMYFIENLPQLYDWAIRSDPNLDISSYDAESAMEASDDWHKMIAGQGEGKMYEPTKQELIVYGPQWKNDKRWQGWTIQRVISENDLLAEGNMMNHCVGDYCKEVRDESIIVYSLRDPQNNPKATIETDGTGKNVEQIQGNSNSTPEEEHRDMIKEWVDYGKNTPERFGGEVKYWDMEGSLTEIADRLQDLANGYSSEDEDYENYLAGDYGLEETESPEFMEWSHNLDMGRLMDIIFEAMTYEHGPKDAENINWHNDWIDTALLLAIEQHDGYGGERPLLKQLIEILKAEIRENGSTHEENAPIIKSFAEHMLKLIYMPEGQTSFNFSSSKNWYKIAQSSPELNTIMNKWKAQGIVLYIFERNDSVILDSLIVPQDKRKQGIGTQIMQEVANYADMVGKRLELSPGQKDDFHGTTSRGRLVNFYKRFGLVENKGRNKDFEISKSMYREPTKIE